jgi:hypothetical protein
MQISLQALGTIRRLFRAFVSFLFFFGTALAQGPAPRITTEIDKNERAVLQGTHPPMARAEYDSRRVQQGTKLQVIKIVFGRSAAREGSSLPNTTVSGTNARRPYTSIAAQIGLILMGVFFLGLIEMGRRSSKVPACAVLLDLGAIGFGAAGCGNPGSPTSSDSKNATKGTYAVTIAGTDTSSFSLTTSTTTTLTVD